MRRWLAAIAIVEPCSVLAGTLEDCIKTDNDLDRLACYDKASGRTPTITTEPPSGAWQVTTEKSAMTDDTNVTLFTFSAEKTSCRFGEPDLVMLWVRCKENVTSLVFSTDCHMASSEYNDYGHVTYRIDETPARTVSMDASTNNRALGLWDGGTAIPVIKQIFGAHHLLARMTPFSESPFTASFDVTGLEEAIKPLRAACRW